MDENFPDMDNKNICYDPKEQCVVIGSKPKSMIFPLPPELLDNMPPEIKDLLGL